MKSKVTARGQVTLPKNIRQKLGIRPGTIIEFELSNGKIIGTKKESVDPVKAWRGKGKLPKELSTVDAYLHEARE